MNDKTELEKTIEKIELSTWRHVYSALLNRQGELYGDIEKFKNIISVNRKHITAAHKRIRVIERGVKLIEKGRCNKAIEIFENEIKDTTYERSSRIRKGG